MSLKKVSANQPKNLEFNSNTKKIALEISMKSILELFKNKKDKNQNDLIAKSVTNLFKQKKKEEKIYKELWVPSQNGFFLYVYIHTNR